MNTRRLDYEAFIRAKATQSEDIGFDCDPSECHHMLHPHQRDIVAWAVRGGRRAIFTAFGLGKTIIQLETLRLILEKRKKGRALIILPLGVRQEFFRDAKKLGLDVTFIRSDQEVGSRGIYLTNYESVREGKINPSAFDAVSLDEAAILRGFGGTKTFREFMATIAGDDRRDLSNVKRAQGVPYRFVATATPSPNEYIELLAYSAFLGVMDVGQAKTRFFKRDSAKADKLTLHPHKEREFWLWVSSWAIFLQKSSDLGYSDDGYALPPLDVRWHLVDSDHAQAGFDKRRQGKLFANSAIGVQDAAREKRNSLGSRIEKMLAIHAENPDAHVIVWHDLEAERKAIEAALPQVVSVYGSQDLDEREKAIIAFSDGEIKALAGKPVMLGSGCNFQRHCSWAIFLGIGFKFSDFIQAIHRLQRFLQTERVRVDLIYTEAECTIRDELIRKWRQHDELVAQMTEIIKEYGLSNALKAGEIGRSLTVERQEIAGSDWRLINNDSCIETMDMVESSVDLIITSIPFATQYEYTPSYLDFGHTDDNAHFWKQMDFLTPELFRVLAPGRLMCIHCKDRVVPGGVNGLGFQTIHPFHAEAIYHYQKHGFAFLGMKTVVTDVVRENAQTYRLGWTEQCKDGTKMGCGMPEYVLIFRKPPSDQSNGYADLSVVKSKDEYSRARWQFDAHGYMRSSGDRLLTPEDLRGVTAKKIFQLFKKHSLESVYDFEHDVELAEALDAAGALPPSFMLLQPQSWHPDVWTDVTRMRTMNTLQAQKKRESHICPLQFDIVDRLIAQYSMPGETVFDPFSGLGTVPLRAVMKGRAGVGIELSTYYHTEAANYLLSAEKQASVLSLFDLEQVSRNGNGIDAKTPAQEEVN